MKIVNGYHYFHKLYYFRSTSFKVAAFYTSLNKYHEVVTPEIIILCKKLWRARGPRAVEFFIYLLIYSNKLAYLQLLTVLIYGSNPPKSHEEDHLNV